LSAITFAVVWRPTRIEVFKANARGVIGTRRRILWPGRLLDKQVQSEGAWAFRCVSRRQPWWHCLRFGA